MSILFFADHKNGALSTESLRAFSAARQLNNPIDIFLVGAEQFDENLPFLQEAAKLEGVNCVFYAQNPAFSHNLAEIVADTLFAYSKNYEFFLCAANSNGKNIFPRLAALLDVMQISNVIEILDNCLFKRAIYTGSAIATVESLDTKKVLTIQSANFEKTGFTLETAPIKEIPAAKDKGLSQFVSSQQNLENALDLSSAKCVIAGGRGFGSAEAFEKFLVPLAQKLNAAIGASRAAVDSGFAPNEWQIGQTGKIIAPELYIAVGISGAMQHIAGMKESRIVIAINKDPEAPILKVADYAIIGDLFEILPEFEKAL